jgi:integrase
LEQAVRFHLIPFNPASRVDPPKVRQDEIAPLDAEQARRLLDAAKGDPLEALYVVSLTCGLRIGEALGLRWTNIDLDAQNVVNRHFKPLLKRAGLPSIRWHDLRHTYATLLLSRGTHPTYVQKSLGHASVQLTLDRYSHWMPSMGRNTAEGIDAALG